MKRCLTLCLLWAVTALSPVRAQELPDPTRPPPEAGQPVGGAESDLPKASLLPQLQSVLIGSHGREVAVIDGQTVRKGEKINGAVLVKVSKDRVVLRRGGKDQVLTLFPAPDQDKTKN